MTTAISKLAERFALGNAAEAAEILKATAFKGPATDAQPTALIERIVANSNGLQVVDPFMGSGTTGVACCARGVPFVGIEMDRRHFDIACERISNAHAQGSLLSLS